MPRFFRLAPKLKGKEGKGFALPDGRSFTTEAALFQALCPSLGGTSFFDYKNLWLNKKSEPTRKYLRGEITKQGAVKKLSDLGLVKNTGKRRCAGNGGKDRTKKHKRGGAGGVPIEVVVELLRLLGAKMDEGELETADAIGCYLERLSVERGRAQGQGQQEEEGQGSEDDYSDSIERGRERESEGLKHKENT